MRRWTVIDTNVLVSGLITKATTAPTARIVDAMLAGKVRYLVSQELLIEYRRVLLLPGIAKRHGKAEEKVDDFLVEVLVNAGMRKPVATDGGSLPLISGDEHVVALLAAEPKALLITGDRALLDALSGVRDVMSPAEFVLRLDQEGAPAAAPPEVSPPEAAPGA